MKLHYLKILTLSLLLITVGSKLNAQTYVDIDATGANDGSSWTNAFTDLQDALDNATAGTEVWVANGTYLPIQAPDGTTSSGATDRNNAFHIANKDIEIYGGFAGTETLLSQRNPAANPTLLSGDFMGNDVVTGSGATLSITGNEENAYHVFITVGLGTAFVLDGFSLQGGNANAYGVIIYSGEYFNKNFSGGLSNVQSSLTLTNVTFSSNSGLAYGGGMANRESSPTLTNVTFSRNLGLDGGGMYNVYYSFPTLTNVTFSGNSANGYGGGIYSRFHSSPTLTNTVFYGNGAYSNGTDISGDNINLASTHNASDGTGGNIAAGTDFVALTADPFTNSTDPDGTDNILGTADDGLVPANGSPLVNAGDSGLNTLPTDIAGQDRIKGAAIDVGAYENQTVQINPDANNILYVDKNATNSNGSGDSWANAVAELADALTWANLNQDPNWATTPLQIFVAKGTYKPMYSPEDGNFGNPDGRKNTFLMVNNVQLYGGFAGTEATLADRDLSITANATTLSGDIGNLNNSSDNTYHVVLTTGLTAVAAIDGFTVTHGNSDSNASIIVNGTSLGNRFGGGMINRASSPIISNMIFSGNLANAGGAMNNFSNSSPIISNSTFSDNSASSDGGGMYNNSSSPSLTNVNFSTNTAVQGGGMSNYESSPTLTNVTFSENSANGGGGMYNNDSSSPALTNVTFGGNSTNYFGGGMANLNSSNPTLTDVTFSGNSADVFGGGMYNLYSSSPILTNVTFSENSASDSDGGGMYNRESSPTLTNVTFSGNTAYYDGGGMANEFSSSPTLTMVTFSGNTASYGGGMANEYSSPTLTNVTFSGNTAFNNGGGMENFSSSPALTNVTFSSNTANLYGGGMYNNNASSSTLYNTVFFDNSTDIEGDNINLASTHNASDGTGGNIAAGAGFVALTTNPFTNSANPIGDDGIWHTADDGLVPAGSPIINMGNNAAPNIATTDITGQNRIQGGTVDMGAYESSCLAFLAVANPLTIQLDATGNYTFTQANKDAIVIGSTGSELSFMFSQESFTCTDTPSVDITVTITDACTGNSEIKTATITVEKRPTTLTYTGDLDEQYSDQVNLSATLIDVDGLFVEGKTISFTIGTQSTTAITDVNGLATATLILTQDPNLAYTVETAFIEDDCYFGSTDSDIFDITQEDAIVAYTGQSLQATPDENSSEAIVVLSANVQDITVTDFANDPLEGDIRNAMVKFVNRDSGDAISGWIPALDLIDPSDPTTATVSYNWLVDIDNSASETITVGILVGSQDGNGYYLRDSSDDNVVVTVYVPVGDFITGGGHIIPDNSAGQYASTAGLKTNFGFNVKFNASGRKLKGHMNVIFRILQGDGVHTYQIKGNAIQSLGVDIGDPENKIAEFITKANLKDITDPNNPISLGGNLRLKADMTDRGEPGIDDSIGLTLTTSRGVLLYSSDWSGIETAEMLLSGGNIVVHSGFSSESILGTSDFDLSSIALYPNPAKDFIILSNPQAIALQQAAIYDLTGRLIQTIDLTTMGTQQSIDFSELASATYMFIIQGFDGQMTKQIIKE